MTDRRAIVVLLFFIVHTSRPVASAREGLFFLAEPAARVVYTNSSGVQLHCRADLEAASDVQLHWRLADTAIAGSYVTNIANIREVLANGTLVLRPFSASEYRTAVHAARYSCVLDSERYGTRVGRPTQLEPVVLQRYRVQVATAPAPRGQTALVRCVVSGQASGHVLVTSWKLNGPGYSVFPSLSASGGGGRYEMVTSGELLVRPPVGPGQNSSITATSFSCRTVQLPNGPAVDSKSSASLQFTDAGQWSLTPVISSMTSDMVVSEGEHFSLYCVAHARHNAPKIRWTFDRISNSQLNLQNVLLADHDRDVTGHHGYHVGDGDVLHVQWAESRHTGTFTCTASNQYGAARNSVRVHVEMAALSVSVQQSSMLMVGENANYSLSCTAHSLVRLHWLLNGERIDKYSQISATYRVTEGGMSKSTLEGTKMNGRLQGTYQCIGVYGHQQEESSALLLLGDSSPSIVLGFAETTLRSGVFISLQCTISAQPPPAISWKLDSAALYNNTRIVIGQIRVRNRLFIGQLNISSVHAIDSGPITCVARNSLGHVTHTQRLNVYGDPVARPMNGVIAVEGDRVRLNCSIGGYPIKSVTWYKDDKPVHSEQIDPEASEYKYSLVVASVRKGHSDGTYQCVALGTAHATAVGHVTLTVVVAPSIRPFSLGVVLSGERVQVLCAVRSGDTPLTMHWLFNHQQLPLPSSQQLPTAAAGGAAAAHQLISTRRVDQYSTSLLIVSARPEHTGNYTCRVANAARSAQHTATLVVNAPPEWLQRPRDTVSVLTGQTVQITCTGHGHPQPVSLWKKRVGSVFEVVDRETENFLSVSEGPASVAALANGTLAIIKAARSSAGHYLCIVDNGLGVTLNALVKVTVHEPPSFGSKKPEVRRARRGDQIVLSCQPSGDSPIKVKWLKDGHSIVNQSRIQTASSVTEDEEVSNINSTLTITSLTTGDSGHFVCHASNAYGSSHVTHQVVIEDAPLPPFDLRVISVTQRSLTLHWSPPPTTELNTPLYQLHYVDKQGAWAEATVVPMITQPTIVNTLRPATTYWLRARALNDLGPGPFGTLLEFRTDSEPPSLAPGRVRVWAVSSTAVEISWQPPPPESTNGPLLSFQLDYTRLSERNVTSQKLVSAVRHREQITDLSAYTRYSISVRAINDRGAGPASSPLVVITHQAPPRAPPATVTCGPATAQSVSVQWRAPPAETVPGHLSGYVVTVRGEESRDGRVFWYEQNSTSSPLVVQSLAAFAVYSVTVGAMTVAGRGPSCRPVQCRTESAG